MPDTQPLLLYVYTSPPLMRIEDTTSAKKSVLIREVSFGEKEAYIIRYMPTYRPTDGNLCPLLCVLPRGLISFLESVL